MFLSAASMEALLPFSSTRRLLGVWIHRLASHCPATTLLEHSQTAHVSTIIIVEPKHSFIIMYYVGLGGTVAGHFMLVCSLCSLSLQRREICYW